MQTISSIGLVGKAIRCASKAHDRPINAMGAASGWIGQRVKVPRRRENLSSSGQASMNADGDDFRGPFACPCTVGPTNWRAPPRGPLLSRTPTHGAQASAARCNAAVRPLRQPLSARGDDLRTPSAPANRTPTGNRAPSDAALAGQRRHSSAVGSRRPASLLPVSKYRPVTANSASSAFSCVQALKG